MAKFKIGDIVENMIETNGIETLRYYEIIGIDSLRYEILILNPKHNQEEKQNYTIANLDIHAEISLNYLKKKKFRAQLQKILEGSK